MLLRMTMLVGAVLAGAGVGLAAVADANDDPMPTVAGPTNPQLAQQGVVWHGNDLGKDERVLLIVGGSFATRDQAAEANEEITFGDLQGYYVARTDQFPGLGELLGPLADEYVLVTAFRTEAGARQFLDIAAAAGAPARLTPRLTNRGWEYVGLGQEAHPDGTGPLIGPLPGVST